MLHRSTLAFLWLRPAFALEWSLWTDAASHTSQSRHHKHQHGHEKQQGGGSERKALEIGVRAKLSNFQERTSVPADPLMRREQRRPRKGRHSHESRPSLHSGDHQKDIAASLLFAGNAPAPAGSVATTYEGGPAPSSPQGAEHGAFSDEAHPQDSNVVAPKNLAMAEAEAEKLDKLVAGAEGEAGMPDTAHTTAPPQVEDDSSSNEEQALMCIAIALVVICCAWSVGWVVFYKRFSSGPKDAPLVPEAMDDGREEAEDAGYEAEYEAEQVATGYSP